MKRLTSTAIAVLICMPIISFGKFVPVDGNPFDPDADLAALRKESTSNPVSAFDPDAYIAENGFDKKAAPQRPWEEYTSDANEQNNLGDRYYGGEGVQQNYTEAAKWFRLAAEQGNTSAQRNLGYCYYTGKGVPRNFIKGLVWYTKAAIKETSPAVLIGVGSIVLIGAAALLFVLIKKILLPCMWRIKENPHMAMQNLWMLLITGAIALVLIQQNSSERSITSIKSDVSSIEAKVVSIKRAVSSMQSDISSIESDISSMQSDISSMESDVSSIKRKFIYQ